MGDNENMENGDVNLRSRPQGTIKNWWQTRTKNEKKGCCCFVVLTVFTFILLGVYFHFFFDIIVICKTPQCQATTMEILKYIDERHKPCDDFYRFACGTFLQNISYEDPYSTHSVKAAMEEEIQADVKNMLEEEILPEDLSSFKLAKRFYRACMSERAIDMGGLNRVLELFNQMGGWPILVEDWNPDNFEWTKAIRNLRAFGANFDFFFNVTVEVDREKPDRYILGIHDRFYSPSELNTNAKITYLDYMVDVASQFYVKVVDVRKDMSEVLNFLLKLGKISEESIKSNKTCLYSLYSLSDLQTDFHTIHWIEFLEGLLAGSAQLQLDELINISEPVYLQKLQLLLSRTNKRIIANFMGWQIVQSLINYLPSRVLDKAYEYLRKINGQFYRKPRWSMCVEATRQRLSPAINIEYIGRHFDEDTRRNVTDLIRFVKYQFRKNLLMADWLDDETKRRILKMLVTSWVKIYSDSDVLRVIYDSSIYDSVKIGETDVLKAVLDLDLIGWDLYFAKLRQPVIDDWIKTQTFLSGQKVIYSARDNLLKFPLALFRGIYYHKNRPGYVNYGLLGSKLAHQISHIFVEAQGITVAASKVAEQRLLNWWSSPSVKQYMEKLQCLSAHYSKLELKDVDNVRTNSIVTRDEDIADLAGYKVAYDAFMEHEWKYGRYPLLPGLKYNARQLFWISSALQFCSRYQLQYLQHKYSGNRYHHSPNEFRVNGPLQNLEEFSYDFGCPHGSYMNPKKKCQVW
ncbi:neprilysin-2-like [Euwallacea similis]|uniref:neprilysin-2-like n=1 Tax=Euwallacea similis TaxID=1736056 RepID=UPI00344D88DD